MVAYGGIWWHMVAYGGIWWHMVARNVRRHPAPFGSVTAL